MESLEGAINTQTLTFGNFILVAFFSSEVYPITNKSSSFTVSFLALN